MATLSLLVLAFIISAIGTLPPGLITLTITSNTVANGKKAGRLNAFGATIPEFIYTYLALLGADYLLEHAEISHYIQLASMLIFLLVGLYYLLANPTPVIKDDLENPVEKGRHFLQGLTAGFFNFLIVPFWLFIIVWLRANGYVISGPLVFLFFSLAGAVGALVVFFLYVEVGDQLLQRFQALASQLNRVIGVLFLGLCAYQVWEVFG